MSKNTKPGIPMKKALMMIGLIVVIVIAASAGVLAVVNGKMSAYEKTTPLAAFGSYMDKVEAQNYEPLYTQFQERTESLSSFEDFTKVMNEIYDGADFNDLSYVKEDKTTGTQEGTYAVYSGGKKLSVIDLSKNDSGQWSVETVMQSGGNLSFLIDVPEGAEVKVNGIALTDAYLKEKKIAAEAFWGVTDSSIAPVVNRYEITDMMSEPAITAEGYLVVKDALKDQYYIGKAPDALTQAAGEKLMLQISEAAARFATADGSLSTLTSNFISSCNFIKRIKTMDNQWYTGHSGVKFENGEVLNLIQLSDSDMIGQVVFDYTVLSNAYGNRTYHCGYQIVLTHTGGSWKAVDLIVNNDLNPNQD